nr:reverse transcriptase domain-containing protein [Tanacetum cinerariifolium]
MNFSPSRTTNLRNEISNFQQRFDESFYEAWDRYKDLLRACPHHDFTELHQLDTFYNALDPAEQDSLNSAAGGNLLERRTQDVLAIIKNKSKQTSIMTTAMTAILEQFQATPPPAFVKAVEEIYVTCGGARPYYQCLAAGGNTFPELRDNIQGYVSAATVNYNQGNLVYRPPAAVNYNQCNSGYRPLGVANQIQPPGFAQPNVQHNQNRFSQPQGYNRGNNFNQDSSYQASMQQNQVVPLSKLKAITTQSGLVLDGPFVPMPPPFINLEEDERVEETLTDPKLREFTIKVPEDQFQEDPEVPMANNRTMAELLQAPTEGYEDAISKSKVRQSRAKAVVVKVSTSSSTSAISSDVAKLKDMVRALLLDKKNQSSAPAPAPTPAPVKAVDLNCVTCGGAHSFRPQMVANQIRPPGFPPVQTHQNNQNNFNRGNNFNQPPAYQAPAYQAPIPQTQSVSKTDFKSYVKANDAVLRNMQNQGQNLQIQIANLTDMLSKFVSSNTASSLGSVTLPSNTITNLKKYLKGITTRSGVAYQGPTIPTSSKVVKQGTEVTKDQVQTPNSQSTTPVQPSVVQYETQTPISEPVVALVSALMPNLKPSIPYPSRRDNERRRDQANEQIEKFYEIFKDMRMDECLALADLGASINLMPLFVWEGLSLPELTLTCMTLKLADRSVSKPIGIAKDVTIKVGVSHFPADFVVVDFEPDPRVLLILERCFLKTGRALIDVHTGELTLRIRNKAITYNLDQTLRYSANYNQMMANKIDVIDMACEEYSQEVLGFSDATASVNPTPYDDLIVSTTSPTLTLFGDNDFLLFEEADAFLGLKDDPNSPEFNPFYYDPKGDILLLKAILNSEPLPPLLNHEQYMPSFKK